jgi:hypothetical protein
VLLARRVPSVGHEGLVTEGRKRRANQKSTWNFSRMRERWNPI